ncbi:MAG: hypothetical protein VKJ06_04625 [Vampirovibrionales bacterium]|nr:hypothetical protein [Vampirovibrionales bacterium]
MRPASIGFSHHANTHAQERRHNTRTATSSENAFAKPSSATAESSAGTTSSASTSSTTEPKIWSPKGWSNKEEGWCPPGLKKHDGVPPGQAKKGFISQARAQELEQAKIEAEEKAAEAEKAEEAKKAAEVAETVETTTDNEEDLKLAPLPPDTTVDASILNQILKLLQSLTAAETTESKPAAEPDAALPAPPLGDAVTGSALAISA